ncbi:MAG: hypothetical protein ACRD2U_02790 [Terriglobales bacterium]
MNTVLRIVVVEKFWVVGLAVIAQTLKLGGLKVRQPHGCFHE